MENTFDHKPIDKTLSIPEVEELELEIETLGNELISITDRKLWSKKMDRYNYLCFKHSQITKDNPETKVKPLKKIPETPDKTKHKEKIIMEEQPKTKKCTKCCQEKPLDQFHKHSASKDGLQIYCIQCRSRKGITTIKKEKPVSIVTKVPDLNAYTAEELMKELHKRGYEGILSYTSRIDIAQINIR